MSAERITPLERHLFLIDLDQPMPGFRKFISCWVYFDGFTSFVVDPGPASTIPFLIKNLLALGVTRPDAILLTHIHIDHGGGTGRLLKTFPGTPVYCHEKAVPHLIAPEKLNQGSLKILGRLAEVYQPIEAVPEDLLHSALQIRINDLSIEVIETPGHAAHHVNYLFNGILFAGEVAGVQVEGYPAYLRPATPPRFIYEIYRNSLLRAAAQPARLLCFGHYGWSRHPAVVFDQAYSQLELWMDKIGGWLKENPVIQDEEVWNRLLENDSRLMDFDKFPADLQEREKYFALNSLAGMRDYMANKE